MKLINKKDNIFGDDIAFVEQYDFSTANMSEENRIKAITTVASICYQNPKAIGSESLYNRLLAESKGLPSSSFEFVPVLFDYEWITNYFIDGAEAYLPESNTLKFGEVLYVDDKRYLLTNYRALIYDVENIDLNSDILKHFNTPEECEIIKQHFKVFLYKVDFPTRSQMVRHRVSWQELCISGDSIITTSQGKQTIKDMFDKQERQRLKYNSVKYPSVKCYDEVARKFTTTKVKEIFYTGKKEVFELVISASGKTKKIKATKDHKFLTKDGWKRLEEIKESDFMALNGQPLYRDKEWLKEQKEIFLNNKIGLQGMSKSLNINYNTLRKWLKIHNLQYTQKEISSTYEIWNKGVTGKESHNYGQSKNNEARQKISEKLSKPLGYSKGGFRKRVTTYWSAEFRKTPLLKKFNNCCNICETSTNLEIDHILPVTTNPELAFNEDNIQILCKDCHREKTRLENSSNRQTIKWGFVTHIKKLEIVDTYDLEVEHPSHNYVANGIVTHNSRRYVSGERVPFEFYVSEKLKENQKVQDLIKQSEDLYFEALEKGVKPQEARRIIPQCAYTQIWGAFMPKQLDNYFKLRLHKTAQWEIQQTSQAMQELIEKENTNGI